MLQFVNNTLARWGRIDVGGCVIDALLTNCKLTSSRCLTIAPAKGRPP